MQPASSLSFSGSWIVFVARGSQTAGFSTCYLISPNCMSWMLGATAGALTYMAFGVSVTVSFLGRQAGCAVHAQRTASQGPRACLSLPRVPRPTPKQAVLGWFSLPWPALFSVNQWLLGHLGG